MNLRTAGVSETGLGLRCRRATPGGRSLGWILSDDEDGGDRGFAKNRLQVARSLCSAGDTAQNSQNLKL